MGLLEATIPVICPQSQPCMKVTPSTLCQEASSGSAFWARCLSYAVIISFSCACSPVTLWASWDLCLLHCCFLCQHRPWRRAGAQWMPHWGLEAPESETWRNQVVNSNVQAVPTQDHTSSDQAWLSLWDLAGVSGMGWRWGGNSFSLQENMLIIYCPGPHKPCSSGPSKVWPAREVGHRQGTRAESMEQTQSPYWGYTAWPTDPSLASWGF